MVNICLCGNIKYILRHLLEIVSFNYVYINISPMYTFVYLNNCAMMMM